MDVTVLQQRFEALDSRLGQRVDALLKAVVDDSARELDSDLDREDEDALDRELLEQLQALHNGIQIAEKDLEAQKYVSCLELVRSLLTDVNRFDTTYPNSLLAVDITRRLKEVKERALTSVVDLWERSVNLQNGRFQVEAYDEVQAAAIIQACPQKTKMVVKSLGSMLITRITQQTISLAPVRTESKLPRYNVELSWSTTSSPTLALLFSNLEALISFCSQLPSPLSEMIPHHWGTYLVHQIVHAAIPMVYPDNSTVAQFRDQLKELERIEDSLKSNGWTHSNELSQFASSFDLRWPEVRRESYLTELRKLYQEATPMTVDSRKLLFGFPDDEETAQSVDEEAKDEWDWDGDDDGDEAVEGDDSKEDASIKAKMNASTSSNGSAVELWKQYYAELGSQEPDPFFTLFRALAGSAYEGNYLWIYADTERFVNHVNNANKSVDVSQLEKYANRQLHQYATAKLELFHLELLPLLFSMDSSKALSQIKTEVDQIARDTNDAGGSKLREFILSRIVEQTCVFIIRTLLRMRDIGDDESMAYAATISKLEPLAIYFTDVHALVPSWTKMERLKDILSGNLTSIRELHYQNMLADFTVEELRTLIEALFIDSSIRRETIREVCEEV